VVALTAAAEEDPRRDRGAPPPKISASVLVPAGDAPNSSVTELSPKSPATPAAPVEIRLASGFPQLHRARCCTSLALPYRYARLTGRTERWRRPEPVPAPVT
jgi:hypothetical protein